MEPFQKKLIAVMNKNKDNGVIMNALAHMSIGLGASIENKEELRLTNYKDADEGDHKNVSEMPFIILSANSNKIRTLRKAAINNNIPFTDFHDKMTIGTYEEQIKASAETKEEELDYLGIVMFGDVDLLSELTSKFSLWR